MAVSTVPVSVTITPDPSEPFEVVISTTDGTTRRYTSVTGSGVAVAFGVGVGDGRSADVAEPDPSLNASAAMITMATTRTPAAASGPAPAGAPSDRPATRVAGGCADPGSSGCAGAADDCAAYGHVGAGRAEPAQPSSPGGVHEERVRTVPKNPLCIVHTSAQGSTPNNRRKMGSLTL